MNRDEQREWRDSILPLNEQRCMGLRLYNGWSEARIGEYLGISQQRVSELLAKARATLAAHGIEIPEKNRCPRGRARAMDPAELDTHPRILAVV